MSDDCIFIEPLEVVIVAESLEVVTTVETLEAEVTIGGQTTVNNAGNPNYEREEFIAALDGPVTVNLSRIPNQIIGIHINGLFLEATKFELLGASCLILATANLVGGDHITFTYY
jgi:hypothetical protein